MLFNLTVVYFAFGAPVGVYGVIRSKGTSPRAVAANFVQFLFWPLFAAVSLRKAFVFQPPATSFEQQIDALRAEFEAEIDAGSVSEFRDVFARYTELALALAEQEDTDAATALLKIANRRKTNTAAACLARRNRRRLEFHLLLARNEFSDLIAANPSGRTRDLTSRLAELLNDAGLH